MISNVSKRASLHNAGSSMTKYSYLPQSKQPTRKTSLSNKSAKSQQVKRKTQSFNSTRADSGVAKGAKQAKQRNLPTPGTANQPVC